MFQSKLIELEEQLNFCKNHQQPILMVLLDQNLKREERFLCAICMENFEAETKIIGFKKLLKMIQENQKNKEKNIQGLIKVDVDLVESLVNEIQILKSNFISKFDELLTNSTEWIKSLQSIGQQTFSYSFFDELEIIINNQMQNQMIQEQIYEQITTLNNSFCNKINDKLSSLKNQELYSQCDKTLINLNLNHNIKLIDDSNKQIDTCYAISFNQSGSLMISASNCDIKVWNFEKGRMNEFSKISGHTQAICCLKFSKNSNSFLSAGFDNSIRCWIQINEKEWKSSQSYYQHTSFINCLILNQSENQLISGGCDNSIKIWKIDLVNNQLTYFYSLDKHKSSVYSLCLNQTEDTLVSCGDDKQIIVWKQDNEQKWEFGYEVTQSIQEVGCRLCFINEDQFIFVTGNQVSKDCISTFELKNQKYQENLEKELRLNKNDQQPDLNLFPICYDKKKNLMIVKHKQCVYLIKISNEGQLKIISQIKYQSNDIFGALTNDAKHIVTWDNEGQKYNVYELYIN